MNKRINTCSGLVALHLGSAVAMVVVFPWLMLAEGTGKTRGVAVDYRSAEVVNLPKFGLFRGLVAPKHNC